MNRITINHYRMTWDTAARQGAITLVFSLAGTEETLAPLSAEEFHVLSTFLRNERPIFWDPATRRIFTANEMVGEEEID